MRDYYETPGCIISILVCYKGLISQSPSNKMSRLLLVLLLAVFWGPGSCQHSIKTAQRATTTSTTTPRTNQSSNQTQIAGNLESDNDSLVVRQYPGQSSCNCYFQDSCGCVCLRPITWEDFQLLPQNFRSCPGFTLALRGGVFYAFPADYFYRVGNVRDFVLDVSGIQFQHLLDPSGDSSPLNRVTFETSAFIRVHRVSVSRSWNWAGFFDLTPSKSAAYCEVQVVESNVPLLTADFGRICKGVVTVVNVNFCGLMAVENRVFATFYKISELDLSNNRVRVVLRSYLPYPARELVTINLANNDIRIIPTDMFSEMPSLQSVDLSGNPITSLQESSFRPIFRSVRIVGLETLPLACDCAVQWLRDPGHLGGANGLGLERAVCNSPYDLRGYSIFNGSRSNDVSC